MSIDYLGKLQAMFSSIQHRKEAKGSHVSTGEREKKMNLISSKESRR